MKKSSACLALLIVMALVSGMTGAVAEAVNPTYVIGVMEKSAIEQTSLEHAKGFIPEDAAPVYGKYTFKNYPSYNAMLLDILAGRVDRLMVPTSVAKYTAVQIPEFKVREIPWAFSNCRMAARDEENSPLAQIDAAIIALKESGKLDDIIDAYIIDNVGDPAKNELVENTGGKTYKVAVTGDLPPMDFVSSDGVPSGFNIALLNAISEIIGCGFEAVPLEAGARFSALVSGRVDLVFWVSCQTIEGYTPEYEHVKLSVPYFEESTSEIALHEELLGE